MDHIKRKTKIKKGRIIVETQISCLAIIQILKYNTHPKLGCIEHDIYITCV